MKVEQIYTGCLSQGAYYIMSDGEAAIIDPLREVQPYIERAFRDKVKIKYIFETHFHADFVSRHVDLSRKTGAPIVFGPLAEPAFQSIIASDGQEFKIGKATIKVLHTPGHTMESSVFLLKDENGKDHAVFSGDTLFLGDVGRPDLAQKAAALTPEDLAGFLYDSLMNKIMPLADDVIVYPAHGAGSACGKNMMKETVDTLGNQKKVNYALNQPDKESFIQAVTEGLLPPPAYFPAAVAMNKTGYESFESILKNGQRALTVTEFEAIAASRDVLKVDTRNNNVFHKGFIAKAINIGLNGDFAPWAGTLVANAKQPLLLITDEGKAEEVITRLSRVGFDVILGHLKGGVEAWKGAGRELDTIRRITTEEFAGEWTTGVSRVIDVRRETEYAAQHIEGAYSRPLASINDWIKDLDPEEHFYLHCAGGYRSMMAASILQARGYRNFTEIEGGFAAISKTSLPTTDFVCQSKLLN
jgi:hydroxyacylglutathione hydrolase